jgi:hypothetical protein
VANEDDSYSSTAILIIAYVFFICLAFYGAYRFTDWSKDGLKSFTELATVGLAAVSAVMGMVISFISLNKNRTANIQLEQLKANLSFWNEIRSDFETRKSAEERKAYADLWAAIDRSYLILAKLETASWTAADKTEMDGVLLAAQAQQVFLRSTEHRDLWTKARQRARFISEEAAKAVVAQPQLWIKLMPGFSDLRKQFDEVTNVEMNRPSSVPLRDSIPESLG